MSYYTKKDVLDFIIVENNKANKNNSKPIMPVEKAENEINTEQDIVGFFWMNFNNTTKNMSLEGKIFCRVDHDLYTDDRFALDLYQAQKVGKTVTEVIKARAEEQEKAKKSIKEPENIIKQIKETIKKNN